MCARMLSTNQWQEQSPQAFEFRNELLHNFSSHYNCYFFKEFDVTRFIMILLRGKILPCSFHLLTVILAM
jgi:hypothetical protein